MPELTEEQTTWYDPESLSSVVDQRGGQRLTISNRLVTKLSFPLSKFGSPTGDINFTIRKVSDDSIINQKVWGDASALNNTPTWREVTFDSPVNINEEVRILAEWGGGDWDNYVKYRALRSSVKENEGLTRKYYTDPYNDSTVDSAYIYTYWVEAITGPLPMHFRQ